MYKTDCFMGLKLNNNRDNNNLFGRIKKAFKLYKKYKGLFMELSGAFAIAYEGIEAYLPTNFSVFNILAL